MNYFARWVGLRGYFRGAKFNYKSLRSQETKGTAVVNGVEDGVRVEWMTCCSYSRLQLLVHRTTSTSREVFSCLKHRHGIPGLHLQLRIFQLTFRIRPYRGHHVQMYCEKAFFTSLYMNFNEVCIFQRTHM